MDEVNGFPGVSDDAEISEYARSENHDPFSTAILHFDFCAYCQNRVMTYINDAAGSSIATVAINPPTMAPGHPDRQPGAVADRCHDQDARARHVTTRTARRRTRRVRCG